MEGSTKSIWAVLQPGLNSAAGGCNPGHPTSGFQERSAIELFDGLPNLLLRVHHDRTVPRDGFLERLTGNQQETNPLGAGLHGNLVAAVKQNQRAVLCFFRR